jgi:hypothetical protein
MPVFLDYFQTNRTAENGPNLDLRRSLPRFSPAGYVWRFQAGPRRMQCDQKCQIDHVELTSANTFEAEFAYWRLVAVNQSWQTKGRVAKPPEPRARAPISSALPAWSASKTIHRSHPPTCGPRRNGRIRLHLIGACTSNATLHPRAAFYTEVNPISSEPFHLMVNSQLSVSLRMTTSSSHPHPRRQCRTSRTDSLRQSPE